MQQYLDLINHVINDGNDKSDRTGIGTRSVFGYQMRFDLKDNFPLLTTKKIHFKSIIYELLWFLNGDTNIKYLNENGIETLVLKQIPDFYKSSHSQELEYAFFLVEATLDACEAASVINLNSNFQIQSNRLEGLKKAKNQNLILKEEADFSSFWQQLLEPMLKRQFNKEPTHSLEEIKRLKTNFPERIKQYNVYRDKKIVAGTTIFETSNAVHTQYIASDTNRQLLGSLDYLFHWLITQHYKDKNYFSFGTSNFKKGSVLNSGLNYWKETFGARTQVHKTYILKTANYNYITSALK